MKDRRVCGVGRVVAVHLAGNHDAHWRRLRLHRPHLHGRSVRAQEHTVALRSPVLIGNHQRVLLVPRRMPRRKIHALEVIEVGLDLRADAHRVAQRCKDLSDLVQRFRDRMLGPGQPLRAGQRDVNGLGGQSRICRPSAQSRVQQALDGRFERIEAHAQGFFSLDRRGLQPPAGNLVEPPFFAPQPLQPEGFHSLFAVQSRGGLARLPLQLGKCPLQRSLIKCRQIGNFVIHSVYKEG